MASERSGALTFLGVAGPIALAHRGGALEAPENTTSAFERSLRMGYRFLETDLRVTADGVCVCFHDAGLERVTGITGRVRDWTWPRLRQLRLADGNPIPRLDDLVGDHPGAMVNVDVKESGTVAPLVDVLRRTRAHDRVCVTSFGGARLRAARASLGGQVASSLAPDEVVDLVRLARRGRPRFAGGLASRSAAGVRVGRAVATGAVAAQIPHRVGGRALVSDSLVDAAHSLGLCVHVWVVDDAAVMHSLLDVGVDGVMTDRPTVLRSVLTERGEWAA